MSGITNRPSYVDFRKQVDAERITFDVDAAAAGLETYAAGFPGTVPLDAGFRYLLRYDDVLYRASNGDILPDEQLTADGWQPVIGSATISADAFPKPSRRGGVGGAVDPLMLTQLDEISVEEARVIAIENGLPAAGW